MDTGVREDLVKFIVANYLFGDVSRIPADEESLVGAGIVDSTGVLELIEFLETHFGIEVLDSETTPRNLGSIASLVTFVERKRGV